jgi:hypothetical protein
VPEKGQVQEGHDEIFAEILNLLEGKLSGLLSPFNHETACFQCCRPVAVLVKAIMVSSVVDLFTILWNTHFAPQAQTLRRI